MNQDQELSLSKYQEELETILTAVKVGDEGEHLWEQYQKVTAALMRLQEIHNDIANLEIWGQDWPELKKFRTLIIDPTISQLEKVAAFESRKITAVGLEIQLSK